MKAKEKLSCGDVCHSKMKMACGRCNSKGGGAVLIVLGVGIMFLTAFILPEVVFPDMVKSAIDGVVLYTEEDTSTGKWTNFVGSEPSGDYEATTGPGSSYKFYHLYNVTNPAAFINGDEKPNVVEVGPFGFFSFRFLYDVVFEEDHIITYKSYSYSKKLSQAGCFHGQEIIGHPEPKECMDLNTTVTILNQGYAHLMGAVPPETFTIAAGPTIALSILYRTADVLSQNMKAYVLSPSYIGMHGRFMAMHAKKAYKAAFDTAAGSDFSTVVSDLNSMNALTNSLSPLGTMVDIMSTTSVTHVFATDTLLEDFFTPAKDFSPFSSTGFETWIQAAEGNDHYKLLVEFCEADGTTDCGERILAIKSYIFEVVWMIDPDTATNAYNDYVTNDNTFPCDGVNMCDWNLTPYMTPYPAISFNTYFGALFSFNPDSAASLMSQNLDTWRATRVYCENPNPTCVEALPYATAFNAIFAEFVTWNEADAVEVVFADTVKRTKYYNEICSIAKMVNSHLTTNAYFEYVTVMSLSTIIIPPLYVADSTLGGRITAVKDLGYLQQSNSLFSSVLMGSDTLSPPGTFKTEFHHYFDQPITMEEVQLIETLLMNGAVVTAIVTRSMSLPTGEMYVPVEWKANVNADFSDVVTAETNAVLIRKNAAGTRTFASDLTSLLATLTNEFGLKDANIYCDDLADCDYRKGGLFHTDTAANLIFDGYTDSAMLYMAGILKSDPNAALSCVDQKFYYTDGTSGSVESETSVFTRDATTCSPRPDYSCDSGFEVSSLRTGSDSSTYPVKRTFTKNTENTDDLRSYYSLQLAGQFYIDNPAIPVGALVPTGADSLGMMYTDVQFQKTAGCQTEDKKDCTLTFNTGLLEREDMNNVVRNKNRVQGKWPHDVPVVGKKSFSIKPQYIDGFTDPFCPQNVTQFSSASESAEILYLEKLETIDYTNDPDLAIPVCRYTLNEEGYDATLESLGASADLLPPRGFFPIAPGVNATAALHVAIGAPSHYIDQLVNEGKELAKFTGMVPDKARHASFYDIEPASGAGIRVAVHYSLYFRIKRSAMYPNLQESYYMFPSSYLTFGGGISASAAVSTAGEISTAQQIPDLLMGMGIGAGIVSIFAGIFIITRKRVAVQPLKNINA